jgi:hypothetical protein
VLALPLVLAACGPRSAEAVADKFVDYYFVEIDQGRALPLTTGLAREMIERELRDVAAVRKQMGYMPASERPDVYYKRTVGRDEGARKVWTYDITLKREHDVWRKNAQVAVERLGGEWKVVFYQVADGEAPKQP